MIDQVVQFFNANATAIAAFIAVLGVVGAVAKYILDNTVFKAREKSARHNSNINYNIGNLHDLLNIINYSQDVVEKNSLKNINKTYEQAMDAANVLSEIRDELRPPSLSEAKIPDGVHLTSIGDNRIGIKIQSAALNEAMFAIWWIIFGGSMVFFMFLNSKVVGFIVGILIVAFVYYYMKRGTRVEMSREEYSYSSPGSWTKYKRKPEIDLNVRTSEGRFQAVLEIDGMHIIGKSALYDNQNAAVEEMSDFYRSLNWWLGRPVEVVDGVFVGPGDGM